MNRSTLKLAILEEIEKMIGEDAIMSPTDSGVTDNSYRRDMTSYDKFNEKDVCEQCGSTAMYEGECSECGYMKETSLNEGGCGCNTPTELDTGSNLMQIDFPSHGEAHKHNHNNYMAKPSLYKVSKYSQKLLNMIPDGYELDDWQRTKIAQLADDISEVYHSLDYDFSGDKEH